MSGDGSAMFGDVTHPLTPVQVAVILVLVWIPLESALVVYLNLIFR